MIHNRMCTCVLELSYCTDFASSFYSKNIMCPMITPRQCRLAFQATAVSGLHSLASVDKQKPPGIPSRTAPGKTAAATNPYPSSLHSCGDHGS